ncbi:reverse transcriptase [Tanacetum coccineum]
MSLQLEAPALQVEIDIAVKGLGAHKAPDEDGFPGIFFQKYWHIVCDTVSKAIQHFFNHSIMPQSLNKTLVVLLPKVPSPEAVGQFRQVSLYCMIVANEAFHYIRNKKKGEQKVMALNLDLNKAFDRVEWDFLMATCRKLGFEYKWCSWVLACVSSYEMDFMINGESIGTIKPSRGIRQGDPMSHFLFIIIADVLSQMINNAMQQSLLTVIKMARNCPVISHIFFADDSLFFLKAKITKCDSFLDVITSVMRNDMI